MKEREIDQIIKEILEQSQKEQEIINQEQFEWESKVKEPLFHNKSKNHNLYYGLLNHLSITMKIALIESLKEDKPKISKATFDALINRKLINNNGELTATGRYFAIASSGLKQQCDILGINYTHTKLDSEKSVEEAVIDFYRKDGWDGFFSEGKVLFELLQGFVFEPVSTFAKKVFKVKGKQEYEIVGSTISSNFDSEIKSKIISNIQKYSSEVLFEKLNKLRELKNKTSFELGYGTISFGDESPYKSIFPIDKMILLFQSIDRDFLKNIASLCLNGIVSETGWPDLIIFNGNSFKLIEVKKGDKLILSQIFTIETLINNGIGVYVFKAK